MAPGIPHHRLTLPVGAVAFQMRGDFQDAARLETDALQAAQTRIVGRGHAMHHRQIMPVHAMRLELRGKAVMRPVGFRHHQQPRGILVDAMDDTRTPLSADARQRIAAMIQ